jgi:signal peptidase I
VERLKRLLTPGHAIAAFVVIGAIYFAWGTFFVAGGTGSNVVLGLLVALAFLYLGTTNFGPTVDDTLAGKAGPLRRALRESREMLDDVDRAMARASKGKLKNARGARLSADEVDAIARARAAFAEAIRAAEVAKDGSILEDKSKDLDHSLKAVLGEQKVGFFVQARGLFGAFGIALILRLWLVAPFQIPSGSMIPTLLIGDHLFVFRASYGLQIPTRLGGLFAGITSFLPSEPRYFVRWAIPAPGDVVVFEAPAWVPQNAGEDWIKRVIATPGQRVKRVGTTIYVDDKPLSESEGTVTAYMDFEEHMGGGGTWREKSGSQRVESIPEREHLSMVDIPPQSTDWPNLTYPYPHMKGLSCDSTACTVNEGHVFVMGDNRDHSLDGRVWGAVPVDAIKGRALFIWVSVDGSENSVSLGRFTLPKFRWDRLFDWIR